jgi:hypothetical protein
MGHAAKDKAGIKKEEGRNLPDRGLSAILRAKQGYVGRDDFKH